MDDKHTILLEITLKSADVFKNVNYFSKMHLYATASLICGKSIAPKQKTCIDEHSGPHPFWMFPIKFPVKRSKLLQNNLMLVFEVKSSRILGDKDIGISLISVKELYDGARSCSNNYAMHVAFPITYKKNVALPISSTSGKQKGVLYISYMFQETLKGYFLSADLYPPCPTIPARVPERVLSAPLCPTTTPSAPYLPEDELYVLDVNDGSSLQQISSARGCLRPPDFPCPTPSAPYLLEDDNIISRTILLNFLDRSE